MKTIPSIVIRAPVKSELLLLPNIESLADALYSSNRFPGGMGVSSAEELEASLMLQIIFVAEIENEIVGFATCRELGDWVHLQQISVIPDEGKKGIGTLLLKKVIEQASFKKYPAITLTTFGDVRWNAPFYKKWGFVEVTDYTSYPELRQIHESEKLAGLKNRVGMLCRLGTT